MQKDYKICLDSGCKYNSDEFKNTCCGLCAMDQTSKWPKGFIMTSIYEPDKKKMVEALRILLDSRFK